MRKWMRERLTRRKKTPAEPSDQPAPPPLQPAYFDAEQSPISSDAKQDSGESEAEIPAEVSPVEETRPARRGRSAFAEPESEDQPSQEQPAPQSPAQPNSA